MSRHKTWIAVIAGGLLLVGASLAAADHLEPPADEQLATEASVTIGYRGISSDDNAGRVLEYDSLEAGPLFNIKLFSDQGAYHLDLDVDYLNEDDYLAQLLVNSGDLLRLDLHSERFFHNLDHIPYAAGTEGSRPDASFGGLSVNFTDRDPGDDYGLRLDISDARLKVKAPDYPAHVNLAYWRYEKQGEKQLRFVDESCTGCHMQSRSRAIDRVTEEVKAGLDAHAGFLDVALEALLRTFRDRKAIPVDSFGNLNGGPIFLRTAGLYEHDEDPDSRLQELTLRLNTAPSGGLVGSASFTLGERENRSDLSSLHPVEAETDYFKGTADVTYTPGELWTVNFRYRLLDMDSDNADRYRDYYPDADLNVRDSIDLTRAWYEALVNYRPWKSLTLKAELRREEIERSDTGTATVAHSGFSRTIVPVWNLPDEEVITRVKFGFTGRVLERAALKLNGWAAVQRSDDPAYGISFSEKRELFLAASYTPATLWGFTASVDFIDEENDEHTIDFVSASYPLERNREQKNFSLGAWLTPREGLSFDVNYGYLRTTIDQDLLFGASEDFVIENDGVDFRQSVQSVTVGVTWQALEELACRLEGYHIRSKASYSPDFPAQEFDYTIATASISSSDLKGISKLDLRQNGLRGRLDWQVDDHWSCGIEATYDNYDERGSDVFDGSVQTTMVSLTRAW